MKIRFTYVRHGQTLFNKTARMQGQCDSPLSKEGIRQAEDTASALRKEHFDHIFCSSSERAWDTAKIIAQYHSEEPLCMKGLKEFDFGSLDGELFSDMNDVIQLHRKADEWTDVGGENVPLFEKRAEQAFEKIISLCKDNDHVLIAGHGSYFSHLLKTILHYDFEDFMNRMNALNRPLVPNCSISEFVYEDGVFRLIREPETTEEYRARQKKTVNLILACTKQTIFERAGRKEGWCDSMLTEEGIRETEETAEKLKEVPIDTAFISTSERARDTADILLKDRDIPKVYRKDLRERYLGLLEGDNKIDPQEIEDDSVYETESEEDADYRALKILREIFDSSENGQTVLAVTHRDFAGRIQRICTSAMAGITAVCADEMDRIG